MAEDVIVDMLNSIVYKPKNVRLEGLEEGNSIRTNDRTWRIVRRSKYGIKVREVDTDGNFIGDFQEYRVRWVKL